MTDGDAYSRYNRLWDLYYAVVTAAVSVAVVLNDGPAPWRRAVAGVAIAVMVLLHATVGRRLIDLDRADRAALALALAQVTLFGVAVFAAPFTTWLLFALIPLVFMLVPMRPAIGLIVLVNLLPVGAAAAIDRAMILPQLVIGAISASTGIWLGYWIMRVIEQSRERAELIDELEASRAEVARLSHETGVAAERARLAGEIHDTLAQGFTSIITLLQAADPELRDERLALAVRTAKENLAEARSLVAALSPSALASASLPDAVRRQAARFTEETGTPAGVRLTGDERDLPTAVSVVLLRAAQEALTNVRRHADAHEVGVTLAFRPDAVRLVVRDDGRGFDPAAAHGFGLTGMRARAEQVNGTLTVHSDPDLGTTIELEVPA